MGDFFEKKSNVWMIITIIVLIILGIWLNFFYFKSCENKTCFYSSLKFCERAKFIANDNMTLEYKIIGNAGKNCIVDVKLLDAGISAKDLTKVKDLDMRCNLPLNVLVVPESDISLCHGTLKEGFQDLIITKLHTYIVVNLGEINQNLLKV